MITATVDRFGMLIIQPSNELEAYALGRWSEANFSRNILIRGADDGKISNTSVVHRGESEAGDTRGRN